MHGWEPAGRWLSEGVPTLICMQSKRIRVDSATHEALKRLAVEMHTTMGHTVTLALRALRQDRVGAQLTDPLREDETDWLAADLG